MRKRRVALNTRNADETYCTSLYILLGAGGSPPLSCGPLDWGLEFEPLEAGGAGRMGRDMLWPFWLDWLLDWLWWLMLLDVRCG
jgi:hypothetical protein